MKGKYLKRVLKLERKGPEFLIAETMTLMRKRGLAVNLLHDEHGYAIVYSWQKRRELLFGRTIDDLSNEAFKWLTTVC
jgi:hypothetical protein